jgi:hypothetical protein
VTTRQERARVTIAKLRGLLDNLPARTSPTLRLCLEAFWLELAVAGASDTSEPNEAIDQMLQTMDGVVDRMIAAANQARS